MDLIMRNLQTKDLYKMSRILKKMELNFDIDEKTTQSRLGAQMIQKAAENLHMAEKEVNDFMGALVDMTGEEFAELPIEQALEITRQFKEQPGVASFLSVAAKSTR